MIHLYVKTHNETGMKYFGKTIRDPFKYKGSGLYWSRHIKKHGNNVSTEIIGSFEDETQCESVAIQFSNDNNIVNSPLWANMKIENGKDGAPQGNVVTEETKKKISNSLIGKSSPKKKYVFKESKEIRSNRCKQIAKGKLWVNDGNKSFRVDDKQVLEEGWSYGRLKTPSLGDKKLGMKNSSGENTRGRVIYNNGLQHKYFFEGQQPDGWSRGKMDGFQGGTGSMKKGKKYD